MQPGRIERPREVVVDQLKVASNGAIIGPRIGAKRCVIEIRAIVHRVARDNNRDVRSQPPSVLLHDRGDRAGKFIRQLRQPVPTHMRHQNRHDRAVRMATLEEGEDRLERVFATMHRVVDHEALGSQRSDQLFANRIDIDFAPRTVPGIELIKDDSILKLPRFCAMKDPDEQDPRSRYPFGQVDIDAARIKMVVVRADPTNKSLSIRHPELLILCGEAFVLEPDGGGDDVLGRRFLDYKADGVHLTAYAVAIGWQAHHGLDLCPRRSLSFGAVGRNRGNDDR